MPSETALGLKASRSALSFVLLVPLTAGGLASSTNQLVAVSFAAPPRGPEAPSPAPAGATARPATHTSVITSRRLLISILPLPDLVRPRRLGLSESWRYRRDCQESSTPFRGRARSRRTPACKPKSSCRHGRPSDPSSQAAGGARRR